MATENKHTTFEFSYTVSCVKTYSEDHTFTREDVENWIENCKRNDAVDGDAMGVIYWDDLTEEEQEAFFKTVAECYSYSDQCDAETNEATHEYNGECGYDEDYDGPMPDTVEAEWEHCWEEWLDARGWSKKITERRDATELHFENSDGLKKTMTYKEYMEYEEPENTEGMVWLQLMEKVYDVERYTQIWIKNPVEKVSPFKNKEEELLETIQCLKDTLAQQDETNKRLIALIEKKDKQIKALLEINGE